MLSVFYTPTRHRLFLPTRTYKILQRAQIASPVLSRRYHSFNACQFKRNTIPGIQSKRLVSSSAKTGAVTNNVQFKLENLFNVKGKIALVTNGGSGIGLMAIQSLTVNGAKVYIVRRTEGKLQRVAELYSTGSRSEGQIIPIVADVSKKSDIERLVSAFKNKEHHLYILINNAGISGSARQDTERKHPEALKETFFNNNAATIEDWESVYRTNAAQLFFITSASLPLLQNATDKIPGFSSTVINITSISGIVKASQHHFAYKCIQSCGHPFNQDACS
ncbi:hypothetical protein TMatcc_007972 [Talaromyces marneffei ATCC 18224]|uniref:Rhamnolipids biosynthesis 3-oxoacyl-[acyl-carrier-protein] reductase n=1 Tax=Talaromyces marneffei PM1 TaxID=1077442 RepID=A0A093VP18_TALMA|nr:uncharacterized protein EYB26_004881 [Talaromyces marneffei]QGA17211.1 hypothetical protein EYB26_004881 [Talaromyces marneffei]